MKFRKIVGASAAAALVVGGTIATASSASAGPMVPASGVTVLMFNPMTVTDLLNSNVSVWSVQPSGGTILVEGRPGAWVTEFFITAAEKQKRITHVGGVLLTHTHEAGHAEAGHTESIALMDPTIQTVKAKISAVVVYEGEDMGRKNIFSVSGCSSVGTDVVECKVKFLPGKAEAVNSMLGEHVFDPEQRVGKADVIFTS